MTRDRGTRERLRHRRERVGRDDRDRRRRDSPRRDAAGRTECERMADYFQQIDDYRPDPPTTFDLAPGLTADVELAETATTIRDDLEMAAEIDQLIEEMDLPE